MKPKKQGSFSKFLSLFLLIIWCCFIFYFSNQNGKISENSSSMIINIANAILKIFFQDIDITNSIVTTIIIRKLAHLFLYFILFLLSFYVSCSYNIKRKYIYCFLFCSLYATSDEIHQLFIYERCFKVTDIMIDIIGSSFGYLLLKRKDDIVK